MGIDIRLPNITGTTDREKLTQMQGYLFQLVEQLNWALQNVDSTNVAVSTSNASVGTPIQISQPSSGNATTADPVATFNSIKSLIIKSADIVDAYYQEVSRRLEGLYVAHSDFGDYVEKTSHVIEETSTSTTENYRHIQTIYGRVDETNESLSQAKDDINNDLEKVYGEEGIGGVKKLIAEAEKNLGDSLDDLKGYIDLFHTTIIDVQHYLRTGLLYYTDDGIPVYGIEVGQSVDVSGEEVFNKYARFTSEKLSFYDSNGNEVAYISDKKLFIMQAEITVAFQIGKLMDLVMDNGDVVTKWVGG